MGKEAQKKILMLTYGRWNHASSRIRALSYIPLLEMNNDWKIYWFPRVPEKKPGIRGFISFALIKRLFALKRFLSITFHQWGLVFVQRMFLSPLSLKILQWRGIPIVYDFDDAIYLGKTKNFSKTKRMVKASKTVIVSSLNLSNFCKRFNISPAFLPSPVDSATITPKKSNSLEPEIVVGWIGSTWTEKYLQEAEKALTSLSQEYNIKLLLVGASENYKMCGVMEEVIEWSYKKEKELLHKMDIGIMPLTDDEWSKGKGGYKIYQYMAAGIPVVASPVGINKKIVDHGVNGFLARNNDEWVKYLSILAKDFNLRKSMGEKGREKMENNYSYKVCFPAFNLILKEALDKN